jgi:uroporphyrin-3 C-methyltransferase
MSQEQPEKDHPPGEPADPQAPVDDAPEQNMRVPADELEYGPAPGPVGSRSGRGAARGISLLALIVAAAALAGMAWTWQTSRIQLKGISTLDETGSSQRSAIQQSVSALQREVDRLEAGRAALESARQDTFNDMAGLSQRLANLERLVADVQGASDETRKRWIISEVEYYLQIANARLQLARDVKSASSALRLADARLSAMEEPALMELRRKIRDELIDLDAVKMPDIQGIALTLGSLGARISQLPLSTRTLARDPQSAEPPAENADGWDRAVSKMGQAFSGIISVRKTDEQAAPVLSVNEEYFLRRNLELKLEAARLALLYADETSYRESLRDARRWLGEYFDISDAATGNAINTLGELEVQNISPALPDISGSLTLLRTLSANNGN